HLDPSRRSSGIGNASAHCPSVSTRSFLRGRHEQPCFRAGGRVISWGGSRPPTTSTWWRRWLGRRTRARTLEDLPTAIPALRRTEQFSCSVPADLLEHGAASLEGGRDGSGGDGA